MIRRYSSGVSIAALRSSRMRVALRHELGHCLRECGVDLSLRGGHRWRLDEAGPEPPRQLALQPDGRLGGVGAVDVDVPPLVLGDQRLAAGVVAVRLRDVDGHRRQRQLDCDARPRADPAGILVLDAVDGERRPVGETCLREPDRAVVRRRRSAHPRQRFERLRAVLGDRRVRHRHPIARRRKPGAARFETPQRIELRQRRGHAVAAGRRDDGGGEDYGGEGRSTHG